MNWSGSAAPLFLFDHMMAKHAIDFCLVTAASDMVLEPGQYVGIAPDRYRLLEWSLEVPTTSMNPILGRSLRDVGIIDLSVRHIGYCGKLVALLLAKVLPAPSVSFHAKWLSARNDPNPLLILVVGVSVDDKQNSYSLDHTDCVPSRLTIFEAVGHDEVKRIIEHLLGQIEGNTMLREVTPGFFGSHSNCKSSPMDHENVRTIL